MASQTVVSLDSNDSIAFQELLVSQVSQLQSTLLNKYEEEVASLRAENRELRERLLAVQGSNANSTFNDAKVSTEAQERASSAAPATAGQKAPQAHATLPEVKEVNIQDPGRGEVSPANNEGSPKKVPHKAKTFDVPPDAPFVQRLVFSKGFELGSGCVILANTMMMALRLQYDGIEIGFEIGSGNFLRDAANTWPYAEEVFFGVELGFTAVFITEYVIRIAALRWNSFRSGWMWFDGIVITVGAVDTFASSALPINPGMLRVLRLMRLVRLFKILKTMQAFDSLFLLHKAIAASMSAAIWSFGILIAVQLVVGLFLNQIMQGFLSGDAKIEEKQAVYKYFGTFSATMLTMFEITMANWVGPCRALVDNVDEWFMLFFIIYRCFFCFAILKVIAAVFITETNRVLQHDDELTLMKLQREKATFNKKVKAIVKDHSGDTIGWDELEHLAYNEEVTTHLSTFGFHPKDLEKLFWLIDDGSGRVAVDLFLSKVAGLRGPAKAVDMLTMLKIIRKVDAEVTTTFKQLGYMNVNEQSEAIEGQICDIMEKAKEIMAENLDKEEDPGPQMTKKFP